MGRRRPERLLRNPPAHLLSELPRAHPGARRQRLPTRGRKKSPTAWNAFGNVAGRSKACG